MNRRDLLKSLVPVGACAAVTAANFPFYGPERYWSAGFGNLGPMILRSMFVNFYQDFSTMEDRYIIGLRHAPLSGGIYDKSCVGLKLPHGTPTPGLDALRCLMGSVERQESRVRKLEPISYVSWSAS